MFYNIAAKSFGYGTLNKHIQHQMTQRVSRDVKLVTEGQKFNMDTDKKMVFVATKSSPETYIDIELAIPILMSGLAIETKSSAYLKTFKVWYVKNLGTPDVMVAVNAPGHTELVGCIHILGYTYRNYVKAFISILGV